MAMLQKLKGSKFLSRRYKVPLCDIFPAILSPTGNVRRPGSSSHDKEDTHTRPRRESQPLAPAPLAVSLDIDDSSSSSESDYISDLDPLDEHPPPDVPADVPRRSVRNRGPPRWHVSGDWQR